MSNPTQDRMMSECEIVMEYAEAYRECKRAEAILAKYRDEFEKIVAETEGMTYVYLDGKSVRFTIVDGKRTNPVSFAEAKAILGFGDAMMAKIASIDAKSVRALAQIGRIDGALADMVLPVTPYRQIRGTFQ